MAEQQGIYFGTRSDLDFSVFSLSFFSCFFLFLIVVFTGGRDRVYMYIYKYTAQTLFQAEICFWIFSELSLCMTHRALFVVSRLSTLKCPLFHAGFAALNFLFVCINTYCGRAGICIHILYKKRKFSTLSKIISKRKKK